MYIGKLGDGSSADDGIYILLKEIIDNSIDEFRMKSGKRIEIKVDEGKVTIRDYGRGIPLGKVVDAVSKMNTGGKYDSKAFKKSVGLNGVGTKAVNALSEYFKVRSFRDGKMKVAEFSQGNITQNAPEIDTSDRNGTEISFVPDHSIFTHFKSVSYTHLDVYKRQKIYIPLVFISLFSMARLVADNIFTRFFFSLCLLYTSRCV